MALGRHAGRFVWLSIDTEKPQNADFLVRFPIHSWPTLLVVDPVDQSAALTWSGIATVTQLEALFDDGERAVAHASDPLARADRLQAAGKHQEAADAYRKLLGLMGPDAPRRDHVVESLVLTLWSARDLRSCSNDTILLAPALPRGPSFANAVSLGLLCALSSEKGEPWRAAAMPTLEALAAEAQRAPGLLADDRSGLFELRVEARKDAQDDHGAQFVAQQWLEFLDGEWQRTANPDARSALDGHLLAASVAVHNPALAIPHLQQSERALPGDYNPPARLASAYLQMGKLADAKGAVERALKSVTGPRRIRVLEQQSNILLKLEDAAGARAALEQATKVFHTLPASEQPPGALPRLQQEMAAIPVPR